jgi:hypothetical protein
MSPARSRLDATFTPSAKRPDLTLLATRCVNMELALDLVLTEIIPRVTIVVFWFLAIVVILLLHIMHIPRSHINGV